MNVTFLGTGTSQGVPVIACSCSVCTSLDYRDKRLRSSVFIETEEGVNIVIDSGPDFRQQMLRERIHKMDALLLTHEHKDHTAGLDDIRAFNFRNDMAMPVFGRKNVLEQLKREFAYIFSNTDYPGIPRIRPMEIDSSPFTVGNIPVVPILTYHHKLPVFGYRIKDFTYITDANRIPDEEIEKIKGSKILVLNALQKEPHMSHFTLDEAVALAKKIGTERTYFTHISHRMGLHSDVQAELPEGIFIAYDGLKVTV